MRGPRETLSRAFDETVEFFSQRKYCRKHRDPDLFDGNAYTIDDWYAMTSAFFDRPWEFYIEGTPPADGLGEALPEVRAGEPFTRYEFVTPITSGDPANDRVPFKWYRSPAHRTLLLFAPGWARPTQAIEENFCARMLRGGVDVGLLTVPYHQARAPEGSYSGEYFISSNLFWTVANFRQFVAEIKWLLRTMRPLYDRVGVVGMSSGGFQTNLATLGNEVDFCIGIMTGCILEDIAFESILTNYVRKDLIARGADRAALARAWAIADMAVVGGSLRAKRIKQFVTHYDPIIPVHTQEALWDVYGRPERRELLTSHYGIFPYLDSMAGDIAAFTRT